MSQIKSNNVRAALDELPYEFARTVVADYMANLSYIELKDINELIRKMLTDDKKVVKFQQ